MLYEFILKLSAKNAWRGQFLRVSKSIWRVKCIAKSHEIEDEFYDFILTKQPHSSKCSISGMRHSRLQEWGSMSRFGQQRSAEIAVKCSL